MSPGVQGLYRESSNRSPRSRKEGKERGKEKWMKEERKKGRRKKEEGKLVHPSLVNIQLRTVEQLYF